MKTQPPLWIFSPFGQPSYCTTSSHSPFGSMRKTRPKGMSTHHRFPSRSNDGPSRKLSTCAAPRLGSDQAVRRFLRNFAGSEVKDRAWMRLIFWKGLYTEKTPGGGRASGRGQSITQRARTRLCSRRAAKGVRRDARGGASEALGDSRGRFARPEPLDRGGFVQERPKIDPAHSRERRDVLVCDPQ